MPKFKTIIPLIYLIFVTLWLRLSNLGYSNYQGDEIKALYLPQLGENLLDFLLRQRKGPIQFLVTYGMRIFNPSYDNELLMRLPFALAGILAIYFFYKFVRLEFGERIALFSSLFFSLNGLFVAFARIVQYQSFVLLFALLTLYFFALAIKFNKWKIKGIYCGAFFWSLSILSHYNGIAIAPFACYLIYRWYVNNDEKLNQKSKLKHICFSTGIIFVGLGIFYLPFYFSLSAATKAYWVERISSKNISSIATFSTYNPGFIIYIYIILTLVSLIKLKAVRGKIYLWLWLLFPLLPLEILVKNKGTHIFSYVLPMCILMGCSLEFFQVYVNTKFAQYGKVIYRLFLSGLYLGLFAISHVIFVDNFREYPWEEKYFAVWKLKSQNNKSLFGFPYYRHWQEISEFLKIAGKEGYFVTNEKNSITRYYIPNGWKNLDLQAYKHQSSGNVFVIFVENAQSHNHQIFERTSSYWQQNFQPVKTFLNQDRIVVRIYKLQLSDLELTPS
ncbi:MAG: glycosyltransferase family 39 protein [Calothrix sp. CSU_2_0]|nr:glycosyltransferase family 39 protein [Calothrix sp. CSU_2_0]